MKTPVVLSKLPLNDPPSQQEEEEDDDDDLQKSTVEMFLDAANAGDLSVHVYFL